MFDKAGNDKVVRNKRATSCTGRGLDPWRLWKSNEFRFPYNATVWRDVMAVQSPSVKSESAFSVSGRLVDVDRGSLFKLINRHLHVR